MTIDFNSFPVNFNLPGQFVEFSSTRAVQGLAAIPQSILLIGQVLAGGLDGGRPLRVFSAGEVAGLTGRGSMLAQMSEQVFAITDSIPVYIARLANAGGSTVSTRDVTFTGVATAPGTIRIYLADRLYSLPIATGATAQQAAEAFVNAIQADTYRIVLPGTAVAGVVALTSRHRGVDGGRYEMSVSRFDGESLPAGMNVVIGALTDGTVNPSIQPVLDAIGDTWFPTIVCPYTDAPNLTLLEAELDSRYGPLRQIEGHAYVARGGDGSELLNFAATRNSPHLSIVDSFNTLSTAYAVAAAVAAADAAEPDPARPRQTLALPRVMASAPITRRPQAIRNLMIAGGISTLVVDTGGTVRIERLTTTYRFDLYGLSDTAYFDVETIRTLATLRYTLRARFAQRYPRHKLGKDGSEGPNVMTPATARGELVSLYQEWLARGWVEGGEAFAQFKRDLAVEIDLDDPNRLNALVPPDLINQLRTFAAQVQFRR